MNYFRSLWARHGDYLVTLMTGKVEMARYDKGCNRWAQDWMGHWETVGILAWDYMPEGYKNDI